MPGEKRGREKGAFCGCVITNGFHESSEEYNLTTLIHTDCSLRCTEILALLEVVSYEVKYIYISFFLLQDFWVGENKPEDCNVAMATM